MFKGLAALFTSGAIWNPMTLIGVIFGVICAIKLDAEDIMILFHNYHLYLLAMLIAFVYCVCFKKVYKGGNLDGLDVTQMILNLIGYFAKIIIASILTISFCYMIAVN